MKKMLALVSMFILVLAGCGTDTSDENAQTAWFVTDTGGINDKSFNQGTWEGLQKYADDNDIEVGYTETKDQSQTEQNLMAAAANNDIVVAAGYVAATPVYNAALANPDTNFILIDTEPTDENGDVQKLDNIHSYLFAEQEAGYLVGYAAGKQTKSDVVGYIGGIKNPPVQRFGLGYVQGVQAANPDAEVLFNYTGSFDNVSLGKNTAQTMYAKGADVIFTAAGGVNSGVVEAAKDEVAEGNEVWVIGVDRDMYEDGIYDGEKSVILTSAVKQVGEAAYKGLSLQFEGSFTSGVDSLGIEEDGVGLPEENPNLDQAIVDEAYESLETTDVLSTTEEVEDMLDITIKGDM